MWNIKFKKIMDDSDPNNGMYFKEFIDNQPVFSSKEEALVMDYNSFDILSRLSSEFNNNGMSVYTLEQA